MDGYDICPDLLFLTSWDKLTYDDQLKKYATYLSHEVHLFLYFKDRPFFDKVIKPFIMNKYEKSLIDHWLLEDYDQILKYTNVEFFDNLNSVEKVLLIYVVVQSDEDTAKLLAERIKLNSDAVEENMEYRNICFDAAINSLPKDSDENSPMVVDKDEEGKKADSIPLAEIRDTPPMSPAYMPTGGAVTEALEGRSRRTGGKKPTKGLATKGLKRRAQKRFRADENDLDNSAEDSEEIDFMWNDDQEERRKTKTPFQQMERPSEYCETHYYACISINKPDLVLDNKFWVDLAFYVVENKSFEGFRSGNFTLVCSNISEIIFSNAFLDLPFMAESHSISNFEEKGVKIRIGSRCMLFKREIKRAVAQLGSSINVIHRFFEHGNEHAEKHINEFLTHLIYGCEVIITNVSNQKKNFQLLWQIPEGALPLRNINYQKSENYNLEPYLTHTFTYYFYFPEAGNFTQFPSNASMNDKIVAVSKTHKFKVVHEITEVIIETFKDILMTGENHAVYDYLEKSNLLQDYKGFSFELIYWMLKDSKCYREIIKILRNRRIYVHTVWQFGFYHYDEQAIKEYISRSEYLCNIIGSNFSSKLYVNYHTMHKPRHLEYYPLINSRAHKLGSDARSSILNNEFRRQYDAFLLSAIEKTELKVGDILCFTYFLLLQDRINEAITLFGRLVRSEISEENGMLLQFDYMAAYLDFYIGEHHNYKVAREAVERYKDHPVLHWKFLFEEVAEQLKEFDGEGIKVEENIDQDDDARRERNYKHSRGNESYLHAELKNKKIHIDYENIESVEIKYYIIDPEILFSKTPFLMHNTEDLAFVKPGTTSTAILNPENLTEIIDIESDLQSLNMIIEVTGDGKQEFLRYYSSSLKVIINEAYGELKVLDKELNSIPQAYVKVFSKTKSGQVKFFRDGYTDINGKFDYAQINSNSLVDISRFAVFVMHDDHGAVTKDCGVPANVDRTENDAWNATSTRMAKRIKIKANTFK